MMQRTSTSIRSLFSDITVAAVLACTSGVVFADAGNGEYLGYRLGEKLTVPQGTPSRDHILGALIFDLDAAQNEHNVDTITVYVSPRSMIIGSVFGEWYFSSHPAARRFADRYLASLESKYDGWRRSGRSLTHGDYQLWVDIEKKPPVKESWGDLWRSPKASRVTIGLIYTPDSLGRSEWLALVNMEANDEELTASQ